MPVETDQQYLERVVKAQAEEIEWLKEMLDEKQKMLMTFGLTIDKALLHWEEG
jgi:hypothetical protein